MLQPVSPVVRTLPLMHDCDNDYLVRIHLIEDTVWKAAKGLFVSFPCPECVAGIVKDILD